jgi:hypothetical protein
MYLYLCTEGAQGADSAPLPVSLLKPQEMTADIHNSDSCQPAAVQRHNKNKSRNESFLILATRFEQAKIPQSEIVIPKNPSIAVQSLQCGDSHLRRG